jgi:Tfp pilus assembly protein FimV
MSDSNGAAKPDADTLRAEIKQTRAELGETVQALAAKADVKARAKEQVDEVKQKVKTQAAEATGKVREAASLAGDRVRAAASQASTQTSSLASSASDKAHELQPAAEGVVRRSPVPLPLVAAGVAALVGIVLIVRGWRR